MTEIEKLKFQEREVIAKKKAEFDLRCDVAIEKGIGKAKDEVKIYRIRDGFGCGGIKILSPNHRAITADFLTGCDGLYLANFVVVYPFSHHEKIFHTSFASALLEAEIPVKERNFKVGWWKFWKWTL